MSILILVHVVLMVISIAVIIYGAYLMIEEGVHEDLKESSQKEKEAVLPDPPKLSSESLREIDREAEICVREIDRRTKKMEHISKKDLDIIVL